MEIEYSRHDSASDRSRIACRMLDSCFAADLLETAMGIASKLAAGPTFANGITKNQLNIEWDMSLDTAIESEAQAQAICMQTGDFERAYQAFVKKESPVFKGD